MSLPWPRHPKQGMCLIPCGWDARAVPYCWKELCHPQEYRDREGQVPADNFLSQSRVGIIRHLLGTQWGQGPSSAAGDARLWLHPALGSASQCRAVLAGHGVHLLFSGVAP